MNAFIQLQDPATTPERTRCEIYTRVMGYYRPVSHFNEGKKSEHYSRIHFTEAESANSAFIAKYSKPCK
jgi:hypothetical protein